jgi:hypothetical protein
VAVLLVALSIGAQQITPAGAADGAPAAQLQIAGQWAGAKLRCQKEENKLVRCGTPTSFAITLEATGRGTTPDESLPREFTWKWIGATEVAITAADGSGEIKLFGLEQEDPDSLTFQAYVYIPTSDPNAPAGSSYIHFVFDVTRAP